LTATTARALFDAGVDILTSGNHIWQRRETATYLDREPRVLRPLNYPVGTPGHGSIVTRAGDTPVLVLNLLGRLFMKAVEDPFRVVDALLSEEGQPRVVVVDFHAEATSEKRAMGFHLDGRVSLMVGTHTHVPTADAQILPRGTAYVTDLGMVGVRQSVIGMAIEPVVAGFMSALPQRAEPAVGPVDVNSVLVDIDPASGKATAIQRLDYHVG
jgi:metallophosphoesterase (TIGR00282 family)